MFKPYYSLIKPGIVYSNALAAAAGFLLASRWHIRPGLLIAVVAGTSLVVASGCVFNNYVDREVDKKMSRTKKRALVSGRVSALSAIIYATILGLAGFLILIAFTNSLTVSIGALGLYFYVVVYGFAKRRTVHGTLVGTISGAAPPVAGYCAATDRLDGGALILFLIWVFWQMPHFYSIAMFRLKDYRSAGIPVLPVVKGMKRTKLEIMLYVFAFIVGMLALSAFGYAGPYFLIVMSLLGLYWLWRGVQGFSTANDEKWARKMFGLSLLVLLALCVMLSLNPA